jgi:hypothetical protein
VEDQTVGEVLMPYITKKRREMLRADEQFAPSAKPETPGELNYAITMLLIEYWTRSPLPGNYTRINDIVGAIECAKLEFQRRVVCAYEDTKILENGDVYP